MRSHLYCIFKYFHAVFFDSHHILCTSLWWIIISRSLKKKRKNSRATTIDEKNCYRMDGYTNMRQNNNSIAMTCSLLPHLIYSFTSESNAYYFDLISQFSSVNTFVNHFTSLLELLFVREIQIANKHVQNRKITLKNNEKEKKREKLYAVIYRFT